MNESDFLINASGHFLSEQYPDDVLSWEAPRRAEYCDEFKCEDFEYFRGAQLEQIIDALAFDFKQTYLQGARAKQ